MEVNDTPPEDPITAAVQQLRADDDRWRAVRDHGYTMVTRAWADADGTVDTLMLLGRETAYGVREDADDRRHWAMRGTLQQIISHAMRLAPPDSPDAPKAAGSDVLPRAEWR